MFELSDDKTDEAVLLTNNYICIFIVDNQISSDSVIKFCREACKNIIAIF
jgi:hypothetical protein